MSKKNTVILIVIIAIIVLILGIWLLFFTSPGVQTPTDNQNSNSPFGNYSGSSSTTPSSTTTGVASGANEQATQYVNNPTSPLIKISTVPIAGAEAFDRKISATTTASIVRYIERATGHTREYNRSTFTLITSSNTTIPSIYQAWWSGNTVLAQFLDQNGNIKTFTGSLPSTTTPTTQLTGGFLADNLYSLAISPKGNRVFTIPAGDSAVGSISNLDGTKKTSILTFPFNEWTAQWPSENTLTLTTKPSFSADGFMYFLSTGGTMTKALGNIAGLTTLTSPNLGYTIYSASNTGGISTGIYDLNKNTTLAFTGNPTLPEKCVWSKLSKTTAYCAVPAIIPIGNYPDDWYKGNVSFVDNIYKVNLSLPAVQLIYKLPVDQSIDAINLFLDPKEENLYFTNKSDYYLWGLTVKGLSPLGL
jgi:hypothetical protein